MLAHEKRRLFPYFSSFHDLLPLVHHAASLLSVGSSFHSQFFIYIYIYRNTLPLPQNHSYKRPTFFPFFTISLSLSLSLSQTETLMCQSTMEFVDVFLLKKFIYLASLRKLVSNCWSFARSRFTQFGNLQIITEKNNNYEFESQTANFKEGEDNEILELRRNDIAMIMQRLGIPWNLEEEGDLSKEEICGIFDEKEAILEEMKEAFNVFDENRDGFIDAEELQNVLCILGFREGLELQACSLMIRSFDENGDGKIDFDEFLRIAENWV